MVCIDRFITPCKALNLTGVTVGITAKDLKTITLKQALTIWLSISSMM